jgi:hypothetical protein
MSSSVPANGKPHRSQPELPSHSIRLQQGGQNAPTSSMMSPHPEQRGGSAKSSSNLPKEKRGRANALAITSCRLSLSAAQARA